MKQEPALWIRLHQSTAWPQSAEIRDAFSDETDVIVAKARETIAHSRELLQQINREEEHLRFLLLLFANRSAVE